MRARDNSHSGLRGFRAGALFVVLAGACCATAALATRVAAETRVAEPVAAARKLLEDWTVFQNAQHFHRYAGLYAPDFIGVRTSGTRSVKLGRAAWLKERRRMFDQPISVRVEGEAFEPRGEAEVEVKFEQRWAAGAYADRGTKLLRLRKGTDGVWRIAEEAMLDSEIDHTAIVPEDPADLELLKLIYPRNAGQPRGESRWTFSKVVDEEVLTASRFLRIVLWNESSNPYRSTAFDAEYWGGLAVISEGRLLAAKYGISGSPAFLKMIAARDRTVIALTQSSAWQGEETKFLEVYELDKAGLRQRQAVLISTNNGAASGTYSCEAVVEVQDVDGNGIDDITVTPTRRRRPELCYDFPKRKVTIRY